MSTNGFESEPHAGHRQVVAAVPAVHPPLEDDQDQRMRLLRQYGNFTLAYSAARQPGLQHFVTTHGFIAFERLWGINFVLGDPVVAPPYKVALLRQYLRTYPKSTFVQVSRDTAEVLAGERFFINEMGLDFQLDLASYDFAGKKKERLRYSGNRLQKRGYTIRELTVEEAGGPERLRAVTETWRSALAVSGHPEEIRFLNRPPVYEDEPGVRKLFVFDRANELVGFYVFDPIYEAGEVIGYSMSVKRRTPAADMRTEEAVSKFAIEQFQREGKRIYKLGLAPMANVEDRDFRCNWFIHMDFRYAFRANWINRYRFPLQAHYDFRLRYDGQPEKVYFATRTWIYTLRAIGLIRLLRLPIFGRRKSEPHAAL